MEIEPYTWKYEYKDGLIYQVSFQTKDLMHLLGLNNLKKFAVMKQKKKKGIANISDKSHAKGTIGNTLAFSPR